METLMTNFTPDNAAVWFEIPVSDLDRARAFYGTVLQTELRDDRTGPIPMANFPTRERGSVAGHLYKGTPAPVGSGNTIHLASPQPLEEALERVRQEGGSVVSDVIALPEGRFAYCRDPDGNSFGLFTR